MPVQCWLLRSDGSTRSYCPMQGSVGSRRRHRRDVPPGPSAHTIAPAKLLIGPRAPTFACRGPLRPVQGASASGSAQSRYLAVRYAPHRSGQAHPGMSDHSTRGTRAFPADRGDRGDRGRAGGVGLRRRRQRRAGDGLVHPRVPGRRPAGPGPGTGCGSGSIRPATRTSHRGGRAARRGLHRDRQGLRQRRRRGVAPGHRPGHYLDDGAGTRDRQGQSDRRDDHDAARAHRAADRASPAQGVR